MGLDHPDHIFGTILDVYAEAGSTRTNDVIDNSRPCDRIRKLCGSSHITPKFVTLVPGYYANQLLDILYLYLPLREIGVRWANHESACHSSRAARPCLSFLRQNPNSSSLLIRLQDGAEVVRLPVGSLTKPQEDEVGGGGSEAETFLTSTPPPLLGCRSHPSKPPISVQLCLQ